MDADKKQWRRHFADLRRSYFPDRSDSEKSFKDSRIQSSVLRLLKDLNVHRSVLSYQPKDQEVAPPSVADVTWRWIYPRVEGERLLTFHPNDETAFETSAWGIREPRLDASRPAPLDEVEAVLVPALAFDRRGHRLGYGKGFYDRFLKTVGAAHRIGLAYSFQVSERDFVPSAWDEAVDWVVTEDFVLSVVRKD